MSQHILQTDKFIVRLGYDRPLDMVFCVIERRPENEIVYSNLSDPDALTYCQDVEYYRPFLEQGYGIKVPEVMFDEVKADQRDRVGNRVVGYNEKGETI